MRRDPSALARKEHDVLVIGGGNSGVCAAWDAALRGLSVALIDKRDLAHRAAHLMRGSAVQRTGAPPLPPVAPLVT